jgi:hypothetical protein
MMLNSDFVKVRCAIINVTDPKERIRCFKKMSPGKILRECNFVYKHKKKP